VPSPISSSPQVAALLSLNNIALQRRIMLVIKASGQSSMSRDRIVKALAAAEGVKTLKGGPRDEFRKHVNQAIGVLLKKAKVIRHGTTNEAVALPKKKKPVKPRTRTQLLAAVRDRLQAIRFTCIDCGRVNEVEDLDQEGWCECLASYFATRPSSTQTAD
jgi:hypothetical protein